MCLTSLCSKRPGSLINIWSVMVASKVPYTRRLVALARMVSLPTRQIIIDYVVIIIRLMNNCCCMMRFFKFASEFVYE